MKIYTPDNQLLLDILVDDSSYRLREIMGANNLELRFSLPQYIPIVEGSYCDFQTERYWMPRAVDYVKEHSEKFGYTLILEGSINFLKSTKFKFFDYLVENGIVKNTSPFKLKFPITATPRMIADLLVANLILKYPQYPWAVGDCIESEPVIMDFNHDFCFDVLPKLTDKFQTEWEVDKYTLHVRKLEKMKDAAIDLSYGYNKGILGGIHRIQYDDRRIINRVYIEGGDRNIDRSTYKNDTLLLPKSKRIVHEGIEYTTDASGSYLERVKPLAGEDDSLDVSKFYPKRVGAVSQVEEINDKQGLYNIIDSSIPELLDFSKLIIAGETMTIIFQTGQLAGKEFDVKYIHATRKFELVPIDDSGLIYPQGNIIPTIGDKYAVFHMRLPDSYIADAEDEALEDTVKYLWENEQAQYSYRWSLDGIYAKRNWGAIRGYLNIGYFVRFSDPQFLPESVNVRIVAVKELVNDHQSPEITIANKVSSRTLGSIINEIPTIAQTVDRKDREIMKYAKRGWKDTQELIEAVKGMVDDFENASLSADVFEGMMALFGSASLQFQFLADDWLTAINPFLSYNPETKQMTCHATQVQHMTLDVDAVQPKRSLLDYKFWTAPQYISAVLTESSEPYFLYLKASKTLVETGGRNVGEATFFISTEKIKIDDIEGFYTLWVGYLNSENMEGDRSFRTMYGYTEILPGQITVDKLLSTSGALVIDLLNGVISAKNGATIQGNIKFISNNGDYHDVGDAFDETNEKIDNIAIGGRNYLRQNNYTIKEYITNNVTLPKGEYIATCYNCQFDNISIDGIGFIYSNKFTLTEEKEVTLYALWGSHTAVPLNQIRCKIEQGNKATDWSPAPEDVQLGVDAAKEIAEAANTAANEANQNVNNLNNYVDGAFKDGVIDNAEAKAIEKYLNTLDETMAQVEATYMKLYSNTYLDGASKINLMNAKINLFGARDELRNSINNAIADGIATPAEKADVDNKFATFNSYLKAFQNAVEDANKAIQAKLDSLSTDKVNNIAIGGRNYLRQNNYTIKEYITNNVTLPKGEYIATCYNCQFDNISIEGVGFIYSNKFTLTEEKEVTLYALWGSHTAVPTNQIKCKIEQGNKATDWSPAPEDVQQDVDSAKEAAEQAKEDAERVSLLLADIADDNKLTPDEKSDLQKEWHILQRTYPTRIDQANAYGISTTGYTNAYNALRDYINTLLTDVTATSNIHGPTFRAMFGNYYDAEENLLKLVTDASKNYSEELVNNIQVGGRNYLRQNNYTIKDYITNNVTLPKGEYIATCYNCQFDNISIDGIGFIYSNKFVLTEEKEVTLYALWGSHTAVPTNQIKCKIEQGNKATDWSPAPEDTQEGIDNAQEAAQKAKEEAERAAAEALALQYLKTALANRTEIDGGLLLTSLLKLGTFSGDTFTDKAGINGTATGANDVVAWFGGTLQEAIQNLASIVFRMDGSGQLAKGNISWDAAGNPTILGEFQGKITSNANGNKIVLDPVDRSVQLVTSSNHILGKWYFYNASNWYTSRMDMQTVDHSGNTLSSLIMIPDNIKMSTSSGCYMDMQTSGLSFIQDSKSFKVSVDITKNTLQLRLSNLPTSKSGLLSGDVWRDGEVLKIVP